MADEIQRIIYKTEIDDSGYIRGVDSMTASTAKLTAEQEKQNKRLQENQAALKSLADIVEKDRRALEAYSGTDAKFKKQLEDSLKSSQAAYVKTAELVGTIQKQYDAANKSAQDFATTAAKATQIQQQTTGGKIPTPVPPTAPPPIIPPVVPPVAFNDFDLREILSATTIEFDKLRVAIEAAEKALVGLDQESEEFKQLKPIVDQGKKALQDFDDATKKAAGSQISIRAQIRQGREELVKLEAAGLGATKQYFELEKRVAHLTDAFQDQQQRIRILASDTKLLDFGKAAITAATTAFQGYTAISVLAGGASEDLQKKTMQLFAAMQLLQSIEQLSNLTRREGILSVLGLSGATKVYEAVVGSTTGSLKAFRVALLGTGIGAAIAAIGFLITKFRQFAEAEREAAKDERTLLDIRAEAIKSYAAEIVKLDSIKQKLNDASIPQKERIRLAKEYNKTAEEGNKIDLKSIDNIDLLNSAIDRQIAKIKERALARAAENVVAQKAEDFFIAQDKARLRAEQQVANERAVSAQQGERLTPTAPTGPALQVGQTVPVFNAKTKKFENRILTQADVDNLKKEADQFHKKRLEQLERDRINRIIENDKETNDAKAELNRVAGIASGFITTGSLITPDFGKDTKQIENVFAQKLRELQARLAEVTAKSFESEGTIRKQFAASLEKELQSLKDTKGLTGPQRQILIDLTVKINDAQLKTALDGFNKKILDARNKLNEQLNDLQEKNNQEQIALIQDEFERRAAQIDAAEKKEIEDRIKADRALLEQIQSQHDQGLISEQQYQDARKEIIFEGEIAVNNIVARAAVQRQDLSADVFRRSLDQLNTVLENQLLNIDEQTAAKIQEQKRFLDTGVVNYDQFQKNITKILKDQKAERDKVRLQELQDELKKIDERLAASITAAERTDLERRQRQVRSSIADIQVKTDEVVDPNKKRTESVLQYVEATQQLTDSIISFWQKANEAESAALDRSIALQEKRVDAAQRIAERGNAQYLKQEQDRLTQLNIQRENAARRQLAIDAALQGSQILVGITGAISKIATPGIGVAETIAEIAVIVGALATGYGLVRSLQGNQPRLREGTPYLERGDKPRGTDTIPAWLTEGEAVIPQPTNKKYKQSVEAIYHGKVPANVLNSFVERYVKSDKKDETLTTVHKVVNEISDKKLSINEVKELLTEKKDSFVNRYTSDKKQRQLFEEIRIIVDSINNKVDNQYSEVINRVTSETQNKGLTNIVYRVVNEVLDKKIGITQLSHFINKYNKESALRLVQDVHKAVEGKVTTSSIITNAINKVLNIETYKRFVDGIKQIPINVLTSFIENYRKITTDHSIIKAIQEQRGYFKGTPDLRGADGIDKIPILATAHEAIIPAVIRKQYEPVINAIFNSKIPAEKFNSFVREYHTIKPVPHLNYERIKETAEIKTTQDSKLRALLQEHSSLLKENNDLQKEILRKKIHVENNIDRDGVSTMVYEWAEQRRKDKRS